MIKKIAIVGAALAMASAASATGLYVGAGLGYQANLRDTTLTYTSPTNAAIRNVYTNKDFGHSASGQIFLGYGLCLTQNFWMSVELNGELSDARSSQTNAFTAPISTTYTSSQRFRGGYGVSLRPAVFTSDQTKLYGVLGWQHGRFESTYSDSVGATTASITNTKWADGFRYGGGIETNFTNQLGGRLEFTQTRYGAYSWALPTPFATGTVATFREKPFTNELTASLVWTIGGDMFNSGATAAS